MRIIAGLAKGHALKSLKGDKIRPTADKVREAVFSVIGYKLEGACFLDLFSGTGAIGIEALSRGAGVCYFNDVRKKATEMVRENLLHCRLEGQGKVYTMDARKFINFLKEDTGLSFDIVYLDPPYEADLYEPVFRLLADSALLKEEALVIAETNKQTLLPENFGPLALFKKKVYGDTVIWYYQHR